MGEGGEDGLAGVAVVRRLDREGEGDARIAAVGAGDGEGAASDGHQGAV